MNGPRILIVDDDAAHRRLIASILRSEGYWLQEASGGQQALDTIEAAPPDLVLLDLDMPGVDGFAVSARLKSNPETRLLPVVIVTSLDALPPRLRALELGVDEFLNKPVVPAELRTRVRSLLRLKEFTDELEHAKSLVAGIAHLVDRRDAYTGHHSGRVGSSAVLLGRMLSLRDEDLEAVRLGALLHDLGKIAVPDAILRKPGPLTPEEAAVMKTHPVVGAELCATLRTFRSAVPIIRHHHEKLDGSGYPDGLRGAEIPLPVRIVTVVDVYDALTTERPYRKALPSREAIRILREEAERGWWDAEVVEIFAQLKEAPHQEPALPIMEGGTP